MKKKNNNRPNTESMILGIQNSHGQKISYRLKNSSVFEQPTIYNTSVKTFAVI